MRPIKVAICGFGVLGRVHADALAGMRDVLVSAICDSRIEKIKASRTGFNIATKKSGFNIAKCRTYKRFETMLKHEAPDAVVIALPTDLHASFAITAMEAGCHVFCEKPMALTVAECDRMMAVSRRRRRQLMIGQCLRFWPEYVALRKAVEKSIYGPLQSLTMERIGSYSNWSAGDWMNNSTRSGGAILDLHLHDVDWAQYALGRPAAIYAAGIRGRSGSIDDVTAVWTYSGGPLVTMRSSWMYAGFMMNFRAVFENAVLEFGFPPDPGLRLCRRNGPVKWVNLKVPQASAYEMEMRYFLDYVRGRKVNTICTPASTRESVVLVNVEMQSIRRKKTIIPFLQ